MKNILLILLAFTAISCTSEELSITLYEKDHTALLIEALELNGIPHKLNSEGKITYSSEHDATVSSLLREVISNDLPSTNSVYYHSKAQRKEFIEKLKQNNINFVVKNRYNEEWVVWENSQTSKVKELQESL